MEEIKRRFSNEIAARLSAAAESDAKSEMIEELADNLCHRYMDLTAAGIGPEEAFQRAMDNLGDVDELVSYLNGEHRQDNAYTGEPVGDDPFWDMFRGAEKVVKEAVTTAKSAWQGVRERIREDGRFQWQSQGGRFDINVDLTGDKSAKYAPEAEGRPVTGPVSSQGLRGIDIQNVNGDVTVRMSEQAEGDILIGGDVNKLEVSYAADGVLILRPWRTASSSLLFRRGVASADIEVCLPCRRWDILQISSVNGDVELSGVEAGQVYIRTVNGDLEGRLGQCEQLTVDTVSGDVDWRGQARDILVQTMSGDVRFEGGADRVKASSMSGDIELFGPVNEVKCTSASGDIRLETAVLPRAMDLSAKSGDCRARIPDTGPFSIQMKTVSGDVDSEFPLDRGPGGVMGTTGEGPAYTVTSVSGDVELKKY